MLLLDPQSRVTAAEALTLPYFSEFREPDEETEAQLYDHSLDNADLSLEQWKREDELGEGGSSLCCKEANKKKRDEGKGGGPYELCFIDLCPAVSSFFRSHLHRDLDLQTCCARIQGNLTMRHQESAMQCGDQNKLTCLFILISTEKTL